MLKKCFLAALALVIGVAISAQEVPRRVALGDWPEARGPNRDGISRETGLIEKWALNGENFLWRVPYGGRSAPLVMGNRVYVQNPAGRGANLQERVMALDADTGKVIWEYKFNLFQSDVPPHRIGWASPAADPETGNVYALSGGAQVIALSRDGKPLWDRSFGEEYAAFTTHGGRTMSPLVDGDLVIVSAAVSNWGTAAGRAHRFIALDKRTGDVVYVANPGGRPYDTAYAAPLIATINGMRLLIAGLGDGAIHAIKPQTGEKVWSFPAAKRAINTGVAVKGTSVLVSHGDENLEGTDLGLIASIDGSQTGDIKTTKWAVRGIEFGYSSPLVDGNRLYQIDNSSRLKAFDVETGRELWTQPLGAAQKAPPVLADGKIYVGTDGGSFFIVRPLADRAEVLSEVELPNSTNSCCGSEGTPEQILGGAAISRGRIFFVSSDAVYAIGSRQPTSPAGFAVDEAVPAQAPAGAPAHLQVSPTELMLAPGQTVKLRARLFDDKGRFLREETAAAWTLRGVERRDRERRAHGVDRPDGTGWIDQGHGRWTDWRGPRARGAPDALEGNLRCVRGRGRPSGVGHRRREPAGGGHARRTESAAEGTARHDLQARPRVHRSDDLVELHLRGRRARGRAPAADGRHRHHRPALFARSVRGIAAFEDRAVGTGDDADGHGSVRLESRHLVPAQAARREPAQRPGARAGKGVAGRRGRTRRLADRQDRSDRQSPGGARVVHRRPVRRTSG